MDKKSIHSCVSDFPYNLGFMGKKWDTISNYYDWCYQRALELFRVLKPGGYCLIFGGTRTHHRLFCAFEDAGFIIKDEMQWIYGSGFPKSYNISKGLNKKDLKELGAKWDGWGTTLKPAQEPIMVCQKPIEKNYCNNIERYGVGGLNIDDCRVPYVSQSDIDMVKAKCNFTTKSKSIGFGTEDTLYGNGITPLKQARICVKEEGRFPTNLILDEESSNLLDSENSEAKGDKIKNKKESYEGSVSRFFYCAKASAKERNENGLIENKHPTVKPLKLIKYLIRLVTPPQGTCLDICEGSGTHAKAILELKKEGYDFNYIGFENDEESYKVACEREKIH